MLEVEVLRAEISGLEKKRAEYVAAIHKVEGAISFAKHLLEKAESAEKPVPSDG